LFKRIDADHEISGIELLDQVPVFGDRLAFDRTTSREGLRKPSQHNAMLSLEVDSDVYRMVFNERLDVCNAYCPKDAQRKQRACSVLYLASFDRDVIHFIGIAQQN
jgi:hypothetical protein